MYDFMQFGVLVFLFGGGESAFPEGQPTGFRYLPDREGDSAGSGKGVREYFFILR